MGNVFLLAGVPRIALHMMDALSGKLEGGKPMLSHTIGCNVAESEVAELLLAVERAHGGCQIGSYPFFRDGNVGANFVIRSTDPHQLNLCSMALVDGLKAQGRDPVDGGI
jgi:molybdopterin-biosynthesis enzyme MoeA-like protein